MGHALRVRQRERRGLAREIQKENSGTPRRASDRRRLDGLRIFFASVDAGREQRSFRRRLALKVDQDHQVVAISAWRPRPGERDLLALKARVDRRDRLDAMARHRIGDEAARRYVQGVPPTWVDWVRRAVVDAYDIDPRNAGPAVRGERHAARRHDGNQQSLGPHLFTDTDDTAVHADPAWRLGNPQPRPTGKLDGLEGAGHDLGIVGALAEQVDGALGKDLGASSCLGLAGVRNQPEDQPLVFSEGCDRHCPKDETDQCDSIEPAHRADLELLRVHLLVTSSRAATSTEAAYSCSSSRSRRKSCPGHLEHTNTRPLRIGSPLRSPKPCNTFPKGRQP